jgi:hypothetical protein
MNRIRRTADQWNKLIQSFYLSGLKASDFCRQHKIDQKYFSKKKSEYSSSSNKTNSFVKVKVNNPSTHAPLLMSLNNKSCILNFYVLPDIEYLSNLIKSVP